ncbi:CASP-like protein 4D1 [Populus alba x Populus x berolinensis]|uniref:CASP-like protein 4D1 n=1 Tax=Populus alba x Populus x berolinensis TaxID=444605 RepID=A0AAD6QEJ9_9ROSI|nr:CASP-like protein 4D1 [Populus alba x Populus x berolinensis]
MTYLLPFFYFCCTGNLEQVILSLLATGVGAGFGATSDLKENLDQLDRFTARIGYPVLSAIRPKGDNFFNTGLVSASLLLMGFLCSAVYRQSYHPWPSPCIKE